MNKCNNPLGSKFLRFKHKHIKQMIKIRHNK